MFLGGLRALACWRIFGIFRMLAHSFACWRIFRRFAMLDAFFACWGSFRMLAHFSHFGTIFSMFPTGPRVLAGFRLVTDSGPNGGRFLKLLNGRPVPARLEPLFVSGLFSGAGLKLRRRARFLLVSQLGGRVTPSFIDFSGGLFRVLPGETVSGGLPREVVSRKRFLGSGFSRWFLGWPLGERFLGVGFCESGPRRCCRVVYGRKPSRPGGSRILTGAQVSSPTHVRARLVSSRAAMQLRPRWSSWAGSSQHSSQIWPARKRSATLW